MRVGNVRSQLQTRFLSRQRNVTLLHIETRPMLATNTLTLVSTVGPSLKPTSSLNFFRKDGSAGFTHDTLPFLLIASKQNEAW